MTESNRIPFLDLVTLHQELKAELVEVFEKALATASFVGGPMVEEFERDFAAFCETRYCVGVGSGTDAVRFALMAAGVKKGSIVVKKGQKVKAGDVLGHGGCSGSAWVPHVHWAMYDRDGIGLPPTFINFVEMTPEGDKKVESGKLQEMHVYRFVADKK